jgi:hypothetical protein
MGIIASRMHGIIASSHPTLMRVSPMRVSPIARCY